MSGWSQSIVTIVVAVFASSGFWAFIQKRGDRKDVRTQMLLGLAHDRLVYLAIKYIERGWISKPEFENLHKYLYTPYKKLGGNGTVTKLMEDVAELPMRDPIKELKKQQEVDSE